MKAKVGIVGDGNVGSALARGLASGCTTSAAESLQQKVRGAKVVSHARLLLWSACVRDSRLAVETCGLEQKANSGSQIKDSGGVEGSKPKSSICRGPHRT